MISTESKLWKLLRQTVKAACPEHKYTRIETGGTVEGVSDIEYAAFPWRGWIELKTAIWPRPGRPFRLQSAYTLAQCSWQVSHHDLASNLRSWVLIGIVGIRTWRSFILIPAPLTTHLIQGRKNLPHERLLSFPGILCKQHLRDVLHHVSH